MAYADKITRNIRRCAVIVGDGTPDNIGGYVISEGVYVEGKLILYSYNNHFVQVIDVTDERQAWDFLEYLDDCDCKKRLVFLDPPNKEPVEWRALHDYPVLGDKTHSLVSRVNDDERFELERMMTDFPEEVVYAYCDTAKVGRGLIDKLTARDDEAKKECKARLEKYNQAREDK